MFGVKKLETTLCGRCKKYFNISNRFGVTYDLSDGQTVSDGHYHSKCSA